MKGEPLSFTVGVLSTLKVGCLCMVNRNESVVWLWSNVARTFLRACLSQGINWSLVSPCIVLRLAEKSHIKASNKIGPLSS